MKNREFNSSLIVFIILVVLGRMGCFAQTYNVPASGSDTVTICGGTIYDPGGLGDYPSYCDGYLVIYPSNAWSSVQISGTYDLNNGSDYIVIYDGAGTDGTQLAYGTGYATVTVTSTHGPLTIYFHSSSYTYGYDGFFFSVWCLGGACGSDGPTVELTP